MKCTSVIGFIDSSADALDAGVFEDRDVEICRLFRLALELQEW
jgi:hypothetical protein